MQEWNKACVNSSLHSKEIEYYNENKIYIFIYFVEFSMFTF